ncbi:MAG: hypothetical protein ABIC91_06740 [Nanoarchaeota archaeon]|nr:hypothetical protein [Nanoarchaeota archaeon]MBU1029691.1 hypothetical protein [Nanoarchaeota archaeon]
MATNNTKEDYLQKAREEAKSGNPESCICNANFYLSQIPKNEEQKLLKEIKEVKKTAYCRELFYRINKLESLKKDITKSRMIYQQAEHHANQAANIILYSNFDDSLKKLFLQTLEQKLSEVTDFAKVVDFSNLYRLKEQL